MSILASNVWIVISSTHLTHWLIFLTKLYRKKAAGKEKVCLRNSFALDELPRCREICSMKFLSPDGSEKDEHYTYIKESTVTYRNFAIIHSFK